MPTTVQPGYAIPSSITDGPSTYPQAPQAGKNVGSVHSNLGKSNTDSETRRYDSSRISISAKQFQGNLSGTNDKECSDLEGKLLQVVRLPCLYIQHISDACIIPHCYRLYFFCLHSVLSPFFTTCSYHSHPF